MKYEDGEEAKIRQIGIRECKEREEEETGKRVKKRREGKTRKRNRIQIAKQQKGRRKKRK